MTAARCDDGTEGRRLGFRGAGSPMAAIADEYGASRLAPLHPEEHRFWRTKNDQKAWFIATTFYKMPCPETPKEKLNMLSLSKGDTETA